MVRASSKEGGRVVVPVISVVDDDVSLRMATVRLLKAMGFTARAFASAPEFLSSPKIGETSCLIADVAMPGMSGLELQEQLIAQGWSIPIIFITAYPEERIRRQAMTRGAIDFLTKPFDELRLLECVERALKQRREQNS